MNVTILLVHGKSHHGKGEFSRYLEKLMRDSNDNIVRCSLSTYIRQIAKEDFYWDGIDSDISREFMGEVYRVGTKLYKYHMARRVWERDIVPNLKERMSNFIIIESFREKANYEYFQKLKEERKISKIITTKIIRPGFSAVKDEWKKHVSESDLDDFEFDYEVTNDGTVKQLQKKVERFLKEIEAEKFFEQYC